MRWILWTMTLALVLSGCAAAPEAQTVEEDEVLLIVDGREIPAWRYFCWLDRGLAALEAPPSEEELEELKERALSDTVLYAAVEAMAAEYGLTLTEEELAAVMPGTWAGLKEARWRELAAVGALYGKLCTMEVQSETLMGFAREEGYRTVDRILIPAGEGAAEKAAQIFAQLNGGGEAAFTDAKALSADTRGPYTFRPGDGVLDGTLQAAAAEMEVGQLSGILEAEEGFSILYCLEPDLSQILIPWVDNCLLQRVSGSRVQISPAYETMDISAEIRKIFGKNMQDL